MDETLDTGEISDEEFIAQGAPDVQEATPIIRRLTQRPDGSVVYFEGRRGQVTGGDRPAGASIADLLRKGYVPTSNEEFTRAYRAAVPMPVAQDALRRVADEPVDAFDGAVSTIADGAGDENMNTQGPAGAQLSPEMLAVLQQFMDEGRLDELFQPFQQEQNVLDQEMALAQGLRQRGPQRSTPTGALFSGLANAAGNIGGAMLQKKGLGGQAALGKRMQGDASGRVGAILRAMQQRKGMAPAETESFEAPVLIEEMTP